MDKIKIYVKSILLPIIVGGVVGLIIAPAMDYQVLEKTFLSPSAFIFPIVWPILYVLMGVSYGILNSKRKTNSKLDLVYFWQLGVNAF